MLLKNYKYYNQVNYWFLILLCLIFLLVLIGGLTRLTNSGLSITEWEVFSGILPPLSNQKWDEYFLMYKQIPQYKLNENMTLNEFKIIFYWEYVHRILARIIGLAYLIPLIIFTFNKTFFKKELILLYSIFIIILFQGFLGWYMVKSGLVHDVTVSHFRLGIHLVTAFFLIMLIYWCYLNFKNKEKKKLFLITKDNLKFKFFIILILLQILIGAYVSGLDAGKIYQTWPLMNNSYFPDDVKNLSFIDFFKFEHQSVVQFIHRNLAYFIFFYTILLFINILKEKHKYLIPYISIVLLILVIQIFLGIFTLISGVNIIFASLHQIIGLFLFIYVIKLNYYSVK
tara:strand:- start:2015 stop:3037 length:1023 start_codon:yes stop_codon:yes gene_type:complete